MIEKDLNKIDLTVDQHFYKRAKGIEPSFEERGIFTLLNQGIDFYKGCDRYLSTFFFVDHIRFEEMIASNIFVNELRSKSLSNRIKDIDLTIVPKCEDIFSTGDFWEDINISNLNEIPEDFDSSLIPYGYY